MKAYATVDLAAGLDKGAWSLDLFAKNLFDKRGEVTKGIQCVEAVCGDPGGGTAIGPQDLHHRHPPAHDRASHRPQVLASLPPVMLPAPRALA